MITSLSLVEEHLIKNPFLNINVVVIGLKKSLTSLKMDEVKVKTIIFIFSHLGSC